MEPVSKTKQAIQAFQGGDFKTALKIASTFRIGITREDSAVMKRGFECMNFPDTYRQLGRDPEKCVNDAKTKFQQLFLQGDSV